MTISLGAPSRPRPAALLPAWLLVLPLTVSALVGLPPAGAAPADGPARIALVAPRSAQAATVTVSPRRPMAGEQTTFSGRLSPRGRPVRLEVRAGSRWRTVARARVGAGSTYRLRARVMRTGTYRVAAAGFTSRQVRVATVAQGMSRTFDAPFVTGLPRVVTAVPTPRRAGRSVSVQRRSGATWTTVATRRTNASGVARVPVSGGAAGSRTWRVVARSFRGAPARATGGVVVRTATTTELLSVGQAAGKESFSPSVSADGRWVAFTSEAALLPSDEDALNDIYLFDRRTGALTHLLPQANSHVNNPHLSGDGRFVAFQTIASNLFGEGDYDYDVAVLDRTTGALDLVSTTSGGAPGNNDSYVHAISDDGRFVAFASTANDLVSSPPPNTSVRHPYLRDRRDDTSFGLDRTQSGWSTTGTFSMDLAGNGSRVVFTTTDTNLAPGNVDGSAIYATEIDANGTAYNRKNLTPGMQASRPHLNRTGELLVFTSTEDLAGDTNGQSDAYLRTAGGAYLLAAPAGPGKSIGEDISADGRYVVVSTESPQPGDTNGTDDDIVLWDTASATPHLLVTRGGPGSSSGAVLSADGRVVVFGSLAAITASAGGDYDVFATVLR
ncbi:PD40 domain-containing protein [Nocardioides caeni]|uniref:PD40 domain-containing protein n=1 Tax=Nocardioides caeni TaxID=574700 RepID=UPI0013053DC7|nr:PD40 domain-containing protein [Nocardioides caeni]